MSKLIKTLVYDNQVSLSILEATDMVNEGIRIHGLKGGSAITFGNMLCAGAYMAGCLKSEQGAISITVKAEGDAGTVSVSGDKNLHIRGYIDGACDGILKGGSMTVIKEDGFFRPFVGTIDLPCNDVSENLMQYFHASEQVPTAVAFATKLDEEGKCVVAGGVVMQLLPGTSDENMEKSENVMQNFVKVAEVLQELGAEGILQKYFSEEVKEGFTYTSFPAYKCNCSRHKISGVLMSMGKAELLDIIQEQGQVSVHCHYCNTDYTFNEEDVERLFS